MSDIIIYGRGKTGQSLLKMLQKQGKTAVFYDDKQGFDDGGSFDRNSLVLLSPGVKPLSAGIAQARKAHARLMSELEYCFPYCKGKCISVTGTNGKTTTCEMIYHVLRQASLPCRLLGNGGLPLSNEVLAITPDELVVLESSSFQLMGATAFSPYISVFTNLACDHLDYHGSFENYTFCKINNFIHQTSGYAVFNADDDNVTELSEQCKCKRLYYSTSKAGNCYIDGEYVVINIDGQVSRSKLGFLQASTKPNLSNALASLLTAALLGIPLDTAIDMLATYRLLPHRMQFVASINGVDFVDDSKATNVHAAVAAVRNYSERNLALILGGSDKGEQFDELFKSLGANVVTVAASGDTARAIAGCGASYNVGVKVLDDISQAAEYCYKSLLDVGGGVTLMSNACASFDKFNGYAERGDYFQQAVKGLSGGTETD